jgi:hypothetical protein
MFKKERSIITFTAMDAYWDNSPYKPVPAKTQIPNWYKNTTSYLDNVKEIKFDENTQATIKKCMPVFDSISAGYLIKTNCDIFINKVEEGFTFRWPSGPGLEFHPKHQLPLYPNAKTKEVPKWLNPWIIQTPKGYSVLIVNPMHRDESPIRILEGIVDTDTFMTTINFPFMVVDENFSGFIPAGTPIAQVIPFKRESWKHSFGGDKERDMAKETLKQIRSFFYDAYKNIFRSTKEFN